MMGRDYIWSLAKPYYQFSPTFIGLGFEAVDAMVTRFYEIGLIDVAYPLHNDILKVFVELGFPGLCFWCAFLYLILPWFWIKRYGPEAGILYFAILNPLSMTYLTDNTAFYFWCTMGLRMIRWRSAALQADEGPCRPKTDMAAALGAGGAAAHPGTVPGERTFFMIHILQSVSNMDRGASSRC